MFYIINSVYSVTVCLTALPLLKITGFQSEFPIILMLSFCLNEPCNLAGWPGYMSEHTALIGIANSAFSHEFGCSIHPHLWQIMLLNWLMCHPLHRVLNHVAHPHDLCSIWDIARPGSDPESLFLACIIGKTSTTRPVHSLDSKLTI